MIPSREEVAALPTPELEALILVACDVLDVRADKRSCARRLADMAVGDSILLRQTTRLHGIHRIYARRYVEDQGAQWRGRTTNHGLRVTRVS